jgi:hypothetical protein
VSPIFLGPIIITALQEIFSIRLVAFDGVKEHIKSGDSFLDDTTCGATGEDVTIEPVAISAMDVMEPEEGTCRLRQQRTYSGGMIEY